MQTIDFWESRAQRYAADGDGLRAVCSFAMPRFYNWCIDVTQRAALREVLDSIPAQSQVLDYGCGVGRWSRELARRGAQVTAVDFSAAMLDQARRRTAGSPRRDLCRFVHCDVTLLDLPQRFDVILGVTVLQHVLGEEALAATIVRLARHLRPGGRLIMVEAAPSRPFTRGNTPTFNARPLATYLAHSGAAGLTIERIVGVDPMPFKLWIVPHFKRWPPIVAVALLLAASALALPLDLLLARRLTGRSWHKVIIATAAEGAV